MTPPTQSSPRPHLLIFGCGYVGGAVATAALARDWRVTALTRNPERALFLREKGVEVMVARLDSDTWHGQAPRRPEFILNSVSAAGGGLPGYWKSYVDGTRSILNWVSAVGGVKASFVYTSSTSVYSAADGSIVDESSETGGGSETSEPLLAAERMIAEAKCFQRCFILRLAGIYGPGRHHVLDQLRTGAEILPGTGRHRLNLIHRDDIVSAILACFDAPADVTGGLFNVAGDVASTKAELTAWLAAALGCPAPVFARDAGVEVRKSDLVRGRSGPVPDRIVSNERMRRVLGWSPRHRDFKSGYRQIFGGEGLNPPAEVR